MSAIQDSADGPGRVINVLITLHPGFDTLSMVGPLEVFSHAKHDHKNPSSSKAFNCKFVAASEHTVSSQGASFRAHMDFDDAREDLDEFDILVIPGGNAEALLKEKEKPEPLKLINAFADLQKKDPSKERTLLSTDTGSLFLAELGLLQGLSATTHPDFYTKLEIICQQAARRGGLEQTDVMEERYVVNNARFELGENEDENPFILRKRPDARRKSSARKGSVSFKESLRRESIARRSNMKLGGLRLITSGGMTAGMDSALYLVSALVSHESAEEVARLMQYNWNKGVTVEGIDV